MNFNRTINYNTIKSPDDGYKELALRVIMLALKDYKNNSRLRPALKRYFFNTDYYFFWCECAGIDPYLILSKLERLETKNSGKKRKTG